MNSTDQNTVAAEKAVSLVLLAVADHFTETTPTDVLGGASLLVCVGAEAYKFTGRRSNGEGPALSKAAMAVMPEVPAGITRGEFALHLRRAVDAHEWTSDDNKRVIPTIPGPRKAEQSTAPTCCGRPMRRDGRQFVCRKCKAWVDPGASPSIPVGVETTEAR